ncbi:PepSY domain-containing protein [Polaromonas sp.]|uniref:PepSY domain-containing protein n=1 Tax=Polaromonas sp. TaxID=1869339 RepID=UPI0035644A71
MKTFIALLCGLLMAMAMPAWANVSRDDAAAVAQQTSGGRVLAVDMAEHAGRSVWRVKVLTPRGEVKLILIDAVSGRTL